MIRLWLLLLMLGGAWAATQAEQDEIWRKALEESAKVGEEREKAGENQMGAIRLTTPQQQAEAEDRWRSKEQSKDQKNRDDIAAYFLQDYGIPMWPKGSHVGKASQIPDNMRGTLLKKVSESTWSIVGSISANVIQIDGKRGFMIDSADLCDDGSITFVADGSTHCLRLSPKDGGMVVLVTLLPDAPLLPAWGYVLRK